MCLDYELTEKQADKIKEQARKRGYIRVWKVCKIKATGGKRYGWDNLWRKGVRKAEGLKENNAGWYAFLSKQGAQRYFLSGEFIKVCYAKHSWIKRLGGYKYHKCGGAAIFTHLAFPDWDKGNMTIREFRAMCKEKK